MNINWHNRIPGAQLRKSAVSFLFTLFIINAAAQVKETTPQKDLVDIGKELFQPHHKLPPAIDLQDSSFQIQPALHPVIKPDSSKIKPGKLLFAPFPAVGYTLQTGIIGIMAMNMSFYTGAVGNTNLSSVSLNPAYSFDQHQFMLPIIFDIWSKKNKLNFVGDMRYYKYPTYTYGLGGHTSLTDADLVDYSYLRIYEEVLKHITSNFYGGFSYNLDYHLNINELGITSNFAEYNADKKKTVSSGLSLNLIYDSRKNINYPQNASYASLSYRSNATFLGSDHNWQSAQLEFRKYISLPANSDNVLGFWNLNWFTFGKEIPYFDFPSTGWDSYSNTGRGYIQGRLRGPGMIYLETEYRFRITRNGLLGGVVFVNGESISDWPSKRFETVLPGTGFGLRIKINKLSGASLSVDYGFGTEGSQGLFFNIGEVF